MRYPRLHFGDGGTLDISQGVSEWNTDVYERKWREAHVRVEWLYSPAGRLDHVLGSVMRNQRGEPVRTAFPT